jgi:hypothetical protein
VATSYLEKKRRGVFFMLHGQAIGESLAGKHPLFSGIYIGYCTGMIRRDDKPFRRCVQPGIIQWNMPYITVARTVKLQDTVPG